MRLLVGVCVYNEEQKIEKVLKLLSEIQPIEAFDVIIGNDGSTDGSLQICKKYAKKYKWEIINHKKNNGIGSMIRDFIDYGIKNNYDVFTTIPGNGKILPNEIKLMYDPVLNNEYDYVKGSRYIEGGSCNNLPIFRKIMIPIFSFIVTIFMKKKVTDVTCLVNALRLDIFKDKRIDIHQSWLDKYELEYYVLYYVLKRKYRFKEVPLDIIYPKNKKNYTKIKPFSGWWSMIKPWVLLTLHIKK